MREPREVYADPEATSNVGIGHNGGSTYSFPGTKSSYLSYYEYLDSDDDPKNRSDKRCEHYKLTSVCPLGSISYMSSTYPSPSLGAYWSWTNTNVQGVYEWLVDISGHHYGPSAKPLGGLPSLFDSSLGAASHRCGTWIDLDQYAGRGLNALYPGIRPQLSLVNSLIELKDFKSMAKGVLSARKRIRVIQDKLENAVFPTETLRRVLVSAIKRRLTLKQIMKLASENYLQWQFALAPLASDIESVKKSMRGARQAAEKLLANEGRPRKGHFSVPIAECTNGNELQFGYGPDGGVPNQFCGRRETKYSSAKFTVNLTYSYRLDEWQKRNIIPLAYLDSLGVFVNPAIIWNALPWSFVVDWVAGVGQWLDQFKLRNLEPTVNVSSCCISAHIERQVTTTLKAFADPAFGGGSGEATVSSVHEEMYFRFPWSANFVRSVNTSGLNPKEFSLSAALGFARLRS